MHPVAKYFLCTVFGSMLILALLSSFFGVEIFLATLVFEAALLAVMGFWSIITGKLFGKEVESTVLNP